MPAENSNILDFEAIFLATQSAYLMLDTDLMIVGVNEAYLQATERSRETVVGRHVFDAFPVNPSEPGASGVPKLKRSLEKVIQTGRADHVEMLRFDIPTGPGVDAPFETRYWSPINSPVFNREGLLTHIIHQAIDITAQVESERGRRESERRFNALTDASGEVIYQMTPDWSHLHQLDGRGFLRDTSSVDKYRLEDYVPPEDHAFVRRTISEAIRNKSIFELEHRVLRVDGSVGWTYSRAVPILDNEGEIVEWIGSAADITSRKVAEEKLKDSNRRKDEFLAMLAHELRNPLAPISAAAGLLHLGRMDEARLVQISEIIARQVKHMTSLIDDLLDVSRVTRGLITLEFEPVDIKHVVADAVEQVRPLIESRRHHIAVDVSPDAALVFGDTKRLVQVVTNLLNNAAKYTPEGGVIDLQVRVDSELVTVSVKDNGIGMAPEFLDRVFEMFSQAQRTADRSQGGLGIGMALVKSLVELHHGSIEAKSDGPGRGSEFTVQLRRHSAPDMKRPLSNDNLQNIRPGGLKVMVVDDNVDAANMLAMYLETSGHDVVVEHESRTALARARSEQPKVFLLDIGLPDMDGNELARQLRSLPELASSCLIAVTGYGQDQDIKGTTEAGFDHHFVKPVDMTKLHALLTELGALH
jgi:signal transduction histidine kinase